MKQKIAIPVANGELCSHFGHCEAFAIYSVEDGRIVDQELVDPPRHEQGSHPQFIHQLGCDVLIAGGIGFKAQELLCSKGVKVILGAPKLPLTKLVDQYLQGVLESGDNRCDH